MSENKRGLATSGGKEHVELVKLATKRIIDQFQNLRDIQISYEDREFSIDLRLKDSQHGYSNASFEFRPDIIVRAENKRRDDEKWDSILDSSAIVFEAETDPKKIFGNVLKIEAYKTMKMRPWGRQQYAFVLVVWADAVLPQNIEPFDEVWKFEK